MGGMRMMRKKWMEERDKGRMGEKKKKKDVAEEGDGEEEKGDGR